MPGDQVGRAYTWRRLRMQLGVHDPARDAEAFARVHVPGRGDLELHRRSLPPAEFSKAEPNFSESRGGSGAPPRARSAPEETPVSSKKSPELLKKEQQRPNFERERQRKKTRFVRQTRGAQDPSTRRSHQYMAELQRARQASPQARAAFEESLRQAKTQPNFERQHQRMKARFVRQTRGAKIHPRAAPIDIWPSSSAHGRPPPRRAQRSKNLYARRRQNLISSASIGA